MNSRSYINRRWLNYLQSLLIMAAMTGILAFLGWLIAGKTGIVWAFVTGMAILIASSFFSSWLTILRMYNARFLTPGQAPTLYRTLGEISRKAGLYRNPALFYIPSTAVNVARGKRQD